MNDTKSGLILTPPHEKILTEYIILLQGTDGAAARSLRQFANKKIKDRYYLEEDKEILNSMRFDVITDRKRKAKKNE